MCDAQLVVGRALRRRPDAVYEVAPDRVRNAIQTAYVQMTGMPAAVPTGITCLTGADVRRRRDGGFRLFRLRSDLGLLSHAATTLLTEVRS